MTITNNLPDEAIHFIEAVTEHFGAPEAVIFHNKRKSGFMTKEFHNKNTGMLFKNENKQSEKHADYRGSVNAAGSDYWIDGWIRTSKKGVKFISFKLKLKEQQQFDKEPPLNDAIPF